MPKRNYNRTSQRTPILDMDELVGVDLGHIEDSGERALKLDIRRQGEPLVVVIGLETAKELYAILQQINITNPGILEK